MEQKTPSQSKFKLVEIGALEIILGFLTIISLIGYFFGISADWDWLDHISSWLAFTFIFYKMDIVAILFGRKMKGVNITVVVAFFLLFFKDILESTIWESEFSLFSFIEAWRAFFESHTVLVTSITFYGGAFLLALASMWIALRLEIAAPSLASAVGAEKVSNKAVKFFLAFVFLFGFYFFVYNSILEWLEFVIDDPVVLVGILFYAYGLAKHKEKFHPDNFMFKIGEFSENFYSKFIALFHYKQTLPIATSGLLILHALSDIGVFAYAFTSGRENLYLEKLEFAHSSWWELFSKDAAGTNSGLSASLGIVYVLNALSLLLFLLIPIIVWWRIFSQKELHLGKGALFFIYASGIAFFLLPAYDIGPLGEGQDLVGVDIFTFSVLDAPSPLERLMPDRFGLVVAVAGLSLLAGVLALLLGMNMRARKELYAFAIACSLFFFGVYLFEFMGSVLLYLGTSIALLFGEGQWILVGIFALLFVLSILFYILGYLLFLYEVIMEYHNQKWSEPVDEELVKVIEFMKRAEQRIEHRNKPLPPKPTPIQPSSLQPQSAPSRPSLRR